MLIFFLVTILVLGSLIFFLSGFFLPRLHRRDDFFWGSVGLFYALNLWVCRESFRGGILLGQVASTALLLSLGWQLWRLRALVPDSGEFSLIGWIGNTLFPQKQPVTASSDNNNAAVQTKKTEPDSLTPIIEEIKEPDSLIPIIEEIKEPDSLTPIIEEIKEPDSFSPLVEVELPKDID